LNSESEIRKNPLTNQRDGGEVGGKNPAGGGSVYVILALLSWTRKV
jgi:hypothetical protein